MILFKNGDKFEGIRDQSSKLLTGNGTLKFSNSNSYYKGKLIDGQFNGEGSLCTNNLTLSGFWIKGKPDIKSEWQIEGPGYSYKGQINEQFKKNGLGSLIFNNKYFYKGDFVNDNYQGQGHLKLQDMEYKGQFFNNKFHGNGSLVKQPDIKYEGNFAMGMFNGGRLETEEGVYIGEFQNNLRHGSGQYMLKNGDSYEGQWLEDEPEGRGKLMQWNSDFGCQMIYEGYFEKGCPEGFGKLEIIFEGKDVQKYEGNFNEGLFNGKGIIHLDNFTKAEGQFFDNHISGECFIYFDKEKQKLECHLKKNQKEGPCSMTIKDIQYSGYFKSNIEISESIQFNSIKL